ASAGRRGHMLHVVPREVGRAQSRLSPLERSSGSPAGIALLAWSLRSDRDAALINLVTSPDGPFTWAVRNVGAETLRALHDPLFAAAAVDTDLRGLYAFFFA